MIQSPLLNIPEIAGLDSRVSLIRIPPELDVPLTPRVRKIIDAPAFRRLAGIAQLGLVSLVYPGARHTRFEHSLGVYRLSLLFLRRLANDERFARTVQPKDVPVLIAAALLHDIGHWPCCHLIEDIQLPGIECHESIAARFITEGEIAEILRSEWQVDPEDVLTLLEKKTVKPKAGEMDGEFQRRRDVYHLFMSILSGPIDIDKMDYLLRDSICCGVPYGHHFDQERLIGSLCLNRSGNGLAITEKGRTAAELMVFARYVMFSEVYWHHTVRAATRMYQRAFEIIWNYAPNRNALIESALTESFDSWMERLRQFCKTAFLSASSEKKRNDCICARELLDGIFGSKRNIYKQIRQFSVMESPEFYQPLAGKPYSTLSRFTEILVDELSRSKYSSLGIEENSILVDTPPAAKEIEFQIEVRYQNNLQFRPLQDVSPVVKALAAEQFDHNVKKIRIFARPDKAERLRQLPDLDEIIRRAVSRLP